MADNICTLKHYVFLISLLLVSTPFMTTTAIQSETISSTPFGNRASVNKCIGWERDALLHFKSYIDHDPYGFLSTWKHEKEEEATTYCCNWSGVGCNNQTGHVTSLDLRFSFLGGKISPLLLNLSYLNHLDLSGNSFNGTIPMFMGSLTQLRYLSLGSNDFSGTIPLELGNLTNLQVLSLDSLRSCTIENIEWLSHLSRLKDLDMSGTSLRKVNNWVNAILSLQNLVVLSLDGCDLSQVMHPYTYSSVNSSFSLPIVTLSLTQNNLNSSLYHWLLPLTSNRLVDLYLSGNELGGIPKYFGNLCSLTQLHIDSNTLPAKFPDILNNLSGCASSTLQVLDASFSQFTESLSDDIQNFSSLEYLDLPDNLLNGTISEKVWQLPKLKRLDVSYNFLKGAISKYIETSKLLVINLTNNSLEGVPLEADTSNLSNMEYIEMGSCKLGPRFPKWIQAMKNLTSIDFSSTQISDMIPEDFWYTWPSTIEYLNMSVNNITGIVTDMLSNFNPRASTIDLSSNNFYGSIPNAPFGLETLDLSRNKFHGNISFLCQIVNGAFSFLDLSHNSFTGQIPDCLWHFKQLKVLSLGHNSFSGRLPASIKYLISLEVLYIYNNSFSGELTSSLNNCVELSFMDLGANNFSGYVPVWIGEKLSKLYALRLSSNNFIGTIPLQLCQLARLKILDLSMNKLYGAIPTCLNNLTSMVQDDLTNNYDVHFVNFTGGQYGGKYVDHAMIKWKGSLREFAKNLGLVKIINLSKNHLSGTIPNELTDLHTLIVLDLSMNALIGGIPMKIGQMKELQVLDLSRNSLSRSIPSSMSSMTFLDYLDVSYNNLSGRIPSSTQLQSFEPSRYVGNARLCGLPLSKYCPGDKELDIPLFIGKSEDDGQDINDLQTWFYIGGATGFAIGFVIVCLALLVNRHGRRVFFQFLDAWKIGFM